MIDRKTTLMDRVTAQKGWTKSKVESVNRSTGRVLLVASAGTCLVTLLYLLLFWNHFVGLRSGLGEFLGGSQFLAGLRPYRDYFSTAMPLNILKSASELAVFGNLPIVSRACGVIERLFIAGLLFAWLAKVFRAHHAALAAIVTMVVSSGDTADPISSYNHDAILFAMACGFLASYALDETRPVKRVVLFAAFAGVYAGLSFATKQTIGPGITVAVPAVVAACLFRLGDARRATIFLGSFALGWALIASVLLSWLDQLGILNSFLHQVFVQGPAAKASHPIDFLLRFVEVTRQLKWSALGGAVVVLVCVWGWIKAGRTTTERPATVLSVVWVCSFAAAAVGLGATLSYAGIMNPRHAYLRMTIYATFFAVLLLPLFWGAVWVGRCLTRREAQLFLFATVSVVVAFMLSLSYPIFEAMTLPGLGLLLASLLHVSRGWRTPVVYAACAALIANGTLTKLELPFSFNTFSEARVPAANSVSASPVLKGFVLPPETVAMVDGTLRIIRDNTKRGDKIFTYPEFVAFYALSGHGCPTYSCSHNIDVVNDEFASREAARLLAKPPAVLIYQPQPEGFLANEELLWRHGRPSGNRAIIQAVEKLASRYRLAASYHVGPNDGEVRVYVKPH